MSRVNHTIFCTQFNVFINQVEKDFRTPRPAPIESMLKALRSDLKLLLETWSVMAGRNILNDMLRAVVAAEPHLTGESKKAAVWLKKTIDKLVGVHNVTRARYDSVLLLGYKVKTSFSSFQGKSDDWADMKGKCDDMKKAIQAAYGSVGAAHKTDPKMLKIFMAPEFFFRGANGGYDFEDVEGLVKRDASAGVSAVQAKQGLMDLMREEVDKDIYKDWLFVLGTVIVVAKAVETRCKTPGCKAGIRFDKDPKTGKTAAVCKADAKHVTEEVTTGAAVDNVALITKEKSFYSVTKELVSHLDFKSGGVNDRVTVRGEVLGVNKYAQPSKYEAASNVPPKFQDERMGGSIFTIDGVTFGCEVCLDHAATPKDGQKGRLSHASNIQIQLIPSAGMCVQQFRTVEDGVVFNVDGSVPHVQAVGAAGPDVQLFQSIFGTQAQAAPPSWDPASMAVELDIYKKTGAFGTGNWMTSSALAPANAPNGAVLQYGPFEIPAV